MVQSAEFLLLLWFSVQTGQRSIIYNGVMPQNLNRYFGNILQKVLDCVVIQMPVCLSTLSSRLIITIRPQFEILVTEAMSSLKYRKN